MVEDVKKFTEELIKSLVSEPDLVKVQDFQDEEENPIIEIMVSESDMGRVIGKSGKIAKAVRTLIQAAAFNKGIKRVKINIDSF
ncbi:MAG: KH domain-containing protein [Bacilli bacterium]|nr:KH domain-containing protein [Bacilli bacterium]